MIKTKIDWTDDSWNPVSGCLHGCEYCYARAMVKRFSTQTAAPNGELHDLKKRADTPYPFGFDPTFHRYRLDDYKNKKGRTIFVGSMTDLFGEWIPDEWITEVFKACSAAPQHRYLFLTKNPSRYNKAVEYYENSMEIENSIDFYCGTTITTQKDLEDLTYYDKKYLDFYSIEPLLGEISFGEFGEHLYEESECTVQIDYGKVDVMCETIINIKWVIIGAESGHRKDKVIPKREWIEKIVDECRAYKIPVFMKSNLAEIWSEPLIQQFPWRTEDE